MSGEHDTALNAKPVLNYKHRPIRGAGDVTGRGGGSTHSTNRGKSLRIRCELYNIKHSFVILMRILLHFCSRIMFVFHQLNQTHNLLILNNGCLIISQNVNIA